MKVGESVIIFVTAIDFEFADLEALGLGKGGKNISYKNHKPNETVVRFLYIDANKRYMYSCSPYECE